jgi:hypothetical protein
MQRNRASAQKDKFVSQEAVSISSPIPRRKRLLDIAASRITGRCLDAVCLVSVIAVAFLAVLG